MVTERDVQPVQRINKKAVKIAIISGAGVFALVAVVTLDGKKSRMKNDQAFQESTFASPALPSSVQELPAAFAQKTAPDQIEEVPKDPESAVMEELPKDRTTPRNSIRHETRYHDADDNSAWRQAKEQELGREADEHWAARRSELFFSNNGGDSAPLEKREEASDKAKSLFVRDSKNQAPGQYEPVKTTSDIMQGTIIHATMLTNLNTDLPGPILAQVSDNVFDSKTGRNLLIPQGSKLIGDYNSSVSFGEQRAQIFWSRIIFPDTSSVSLGRMVGIDRQGASGNQGEVDHHLRQAFGGAILSTLLNTGASMTREKGSHNSSVGQELADSTGNTANRIAGKIADKTMDIPPTITIKSGTKVNVFVARDLELKPYRR